MKLAMLITFKQGQVVSSYLVGGWTRQGVSGEHRLRLNGTDVGP
jgi:hypothetical protein